METNYKKLLEGYFLLKTILGFTGIILYLTNNFYQILSTPVLSYVSYLFGDLGLFRITFVIPFALSTMSLITYYAIKKDIGFAKVLAILVLPLDLFAFPVGTIITLTFIVIALFKTSFQPLRKEQSMYRAIGAGVLAFSITLLMIVSGFTATITDVEPLVSAQAKLQAVEGLEGEIEVIVILETPDEFSDTIRSQNVFVQNVEALGGDIISTTYNVENSITTKIDADQLQFLAASSEVKAIIPNEVVWYAPESNDDIDYSQTHMLDNSWELLGADKLWEQGITGENTVVAVVDTGIASGLQAFQKDGKSIVIDSFTVTGDEYVWWHGTSVASCIASQDPVRKGIAPDCKLLNVQVFKKVGAGIGADLSSIRKGWDWVAGWARNHPEKRVICCNSLGAPASYETRQALDIMANEMVTKNNIPMIIAAGNGPPLSTNSPGTAKNVLTVGAVDDNQLIASFSCRGTGKPDVVAPGVNVKMIAPPGQWGSRFVLSNTYFFASGTSFATPLTAGVVALITQEHMEHSAIQIQNAIKDSAYDLGIHDYDTNYGYGFVDAEDANAVLNGEKPEKYYTAVPLGDFELPLGILPIFVIIGIIIVFYPEIKKHRR